jgi:hypothetical protein
LEDHASSLTLSLVSSSISLFIVEDFTISFFIAFDVFGTLIIYLLGFVGNIERKIITQEEHHAGRIIQFCEK